MVPRFYWLVVAQQQHLVVVTVLRHVVILRLHQDQVVAARVVAARVVAAVLCIVPQRPFFFSLSRLETKVTLFPTSIIIAWYSRYKNTMTLWVVDYRRWKYFPFPGFKLQNNTLRQTSLWIVIYTHILKPYLPHCSMEDVDLHHSVHVYMYFFFFGGLAIC